MSAYTIRPAHPDEVGPLPALEVAASALYPDEDVAPELKAVGMPASEFAAAARDGRLWLAVESSSETAVGFAMARVVDGRTHLFELDVHPDHGRQGLGTRLVEAVVESARARGDADVTLSTFIHLPWNKPFYERLGFVVMAPGEIEPEFTEVLRKEVVSGLDPAKRVAMHRVLD